MGRKAKTEGWKRRKLTPRGVDTYPTSPPVTGNRIAEDREGQARKVEARVCVRACRGRPTSDALYSGCIPTFARG